MKGKKGGESPSSGVAFTNAAIPCTSKGNILAAAKKRRRGGAVASMKVDGDAPKARLDKPKRARGGATEDSNVQRQRTKANAQLSDMMSKRAAKAAPQSNEDRQKARSAGLLSDMMSKRAAGGGVVKDAEKAAGTMLSAAKNSDAALPKLTPGSKTGPALKSKALRGDRSKPVERARGGKVGADTSPMTHAARKTPMRGHSTQPNIT